ncbi:MAG: methyltransferase domain-containing protein [Bacteroidota bacterium]|nr:methyltransferase domain-containing protein [Bacteroidota bacterium]
MERKHDAEIMDDFSIQDERIDEALNELRTINIFLGGTATTHNGFRILRKKKSLQNKLTVLDVGAGGADVFGNESNDLSITALDKNPRTCEYLRDHTNYTVLCGDAMDIPLKEQSFDVVHISLFLHHFTEEQIVALLKSFSRVAHHGIIINDLRRSFFALTGIKILTLLFSQSKMVKHDAPLSVQRGFTKEELLRIFDRCSLRNLIIKRTWAFRWLVVIEL